VNCVPNRRTILKLERKSLFFSFAHFRKEPVWYSACYLYALQHTDFYVISSLPVTLLWLSSHSHTTSKCSSTDRQMCLFIHEKWSHTDKMRSKFWNHLEITKCLLPKAFPKLFFILCNNEVVILDVCYEVKVGIPVAQIMSICD
jgi:hypothetical protein